MDRFDAAIADLERALQVCPEEAWEQSVWEVKQTDPWIWPAAGMQPIAERTPESIQRMSQFWAVAYHCLWYLDQYTLPEFEMPTKFVDARGGPEELPFPAADGAAPIPGPAISRDVLLRFLDFGREQLRARISTVDMTAAVSNHHPHAGKTLAELYEVNLDHIREHGAQLLAFATARARANASQP
jgi:hypothetical protein